MSATLQYRIVDVFTAQPFDGNPAAVVLGAAGLSDERMRLIAAEFALSETAFVVPMVPGQSGDLALRWFTPTCEVDMCGHATLAAIHALLEEQLLPIDVAQGGMVGIATKSGTLQAVLDPAPPPGGSRIIWLDLIAPTLRPQLFAPDEWCELLQCSPDVFISHPPPVCTQDGDLIVFVAGPIALNELRPDMSALTRWLDRRQLCGLCIATTSTLAPSITVQSRLFAPNIGINEDPVTGNVHGPLAAHLMEHGMVPRFHDMAALTCIQRIPGGRGGLVRVLVQQQEDRHCEVRIGGECVTVARGTLLAE